jgi:hypothetical protein
MKRSAATLALCFGLCSPALFASEGHAPAAATTSVPVVAEAAASAEASSVAGFEAKETVCRNGKNIRKVKLGFADIKTGSDCKVSYLKETEQPGDEKVLWNARNDAKFCQEHAQGFVEKLKGQGWSCE